MGDENLAEAGSSSSRVVMFATAAVALIALIVVLSFVFSGDKQITGDTRTQLIDVAVTELGPGEITGVEEGNDGTAYEVEIIPEGDTQEYEVRIDDSFNVVEVVLDD